MTKARGPHVRQRALTKPFLCVYGHKRWGRHPILVAFFSLSRRLIVGSHERLVDWILFTVFSEFHPPTFALVTHLALQEFLLQAEKYLN